MLSDLALWVRTRLAKSYPSVLKPHRGQLILSLAVLGWLLPVVALFAWAMGQGDLDAMRQGTMDRSGEAQTSSGRTLGMLATLMYGGLILVVLIAKANR